MRRRTIAWFALLLFVACGPLPAAAAQSSSPGAYRSEALSLEVALPEGWAVADEPWAITASHTGLLAFNNWGEAGFQTPSLSRENLLYWKPVNILRLLPPGGALITLAEVQGGGALWHAENYGPEWKQQDLRGLWPGGDCRTGTGVTRLALHKWGRSLLLEVLCRPDATHETAAAVNRLLDSWRFDAAPAGDAGWAVLQARPLLPWAAFRERFPLLQGRLALPPGGEPVRSAWTDDGLLRSTTAGLAGDDVAVTFRLEWDAAGRRVPRGPDRHSRWRATTPDHWWQFQVGPDGSVARAGEGGGPLPARALEAEEPARTPQPLALYEDPAMGFRLRYPADWQQAEFTRSNDTPTATFADGNPPPGTMYRDTVWVQVYPDLSSGTYPSLAYSTTLSFLDRRPPEVRDEVLAACPVDAPVRSFALYRVPSGDSVLAAVRGGWGYQIWLSGRWLSGEESRVDVMLCSFQFLAPSGGAAGPADP